MSNWVNWCDASLESDARYFYKDLFTKDIHVNNIEFRLRLTGRASASSASRKDYSDWSKHQDELGAFKPSLVLVDAVSGKEIMREGEILKTVSADVAGWRKSSGRFNTAADQVWIQGKKQKDGELVLEASYVFKCRISVLSTKNDHRNFRLRVQLPSAGGKGGKEEGAVVLSEAVGIQVLARPQKPELMFEYLPHHTVGELKDMVYVLCGQCVAWCT